MLQMYKHLWLQCKTCFLSHGLHWRQQLEYSIYLKWYLYRKINKHQVFMYIFKLIIAVILLFSKLNVIIYVGNVFQQVKYNEWHMYIPL